jgi:anti-sigma factor RsiW
MLTNEQQHQFDWNDRLQDWLDGDLSSTDAAAVEAHLAQCPLCPAQIEAFTALDTALSHASPHVSLAQSFDERLFAQIDAIDESKRAQARARLEQELQQNLSELSRGWRRALAFMIPGVVAGIALAFALTTWMDDTGLARTLALQGAGQLGGGHSADLIQLALTTLVGTGLGLVVARWLASVAD